MGTVRVLLDTHALLWWLFDDKRLSAQARTLIAAADNELIVSSASAWEITTKHRTGKLPTPATCPRAFLSIYARRGCPCLPSRWNTRWRPARCQGRIETHSTAC